MTIGPYLVLFACMLVVIAVMTVLAALQLIDRRRANPSIKKRREELYRAVMLDEITTDEYAEKRIALDDEASRARRRKT